MGLNREDSFPEPLWALLLRPRRAVSIVFAKATVSFTIIPSLMRAAVMPRGG